MTEKPPEKAPEKAPDKAPEKPGEKGAAPAPEAALIPQALNIIKTLETLEKEFSTFNQRVQEKTEICDGVKKSIEENAGINEKIHQIQKILSHLIEEDWKNMRLIHAADYADRLNSRLESLAQQGGKAPAPGAAPAAAPAAGDAKK